MSTATETKITKGDIWYSSGGYDQTNVKFYRVIRTTKAMVILEAIGTTVTENGFMCGSAVPETSVATGTEDLRRKVKWYSDSPMIVVDNYSMGACAYPWDGTAKYCSWYA